MDFRNTNTQNYSLDNERFDIKAYSILDKVPAELYREVLAWSEDKLDFNTMTVSISDHKAQKTLIVLNNRPVVVDGLGMCEIELRGALQCIEIAGHESITLNTNFLPVLHYSNGEHAMTMILDREDDELEWAINEIVLPVLHNKFKEVAISRKVEPINMTMTRFLTSEKDVKSFMNEDVMNFITKPITAEDMEEELKSAKKDQTKNKRKAQRKARKNKKK